MAEGTVGTADCIAMSALVLDETMVLAMPDIGPRRPIVRPTARFKLPEGGAHADARGRR
jgi:hypothetical protein